MLKLVLVDDERRVCSLLRHLLNWEDLGIQIVGEAWDGLSALTLIQEKQPDIVITDIRMPGMNGLELVRQIHEQSPAIRIILLSGHRQFEYAQSAIKYGVEQYLLKPIVKEEVLDNILAIKARIEEENQSQAERVALENTLQRNADQLRQHLIHTLVAEGPAPLAGQSLDEINEAFATRFTQGYFRAIELKADSIGYFDAEQMNIALGTILHIVHKRLDAVCVDSLWKKGESSLYGLVNYTEEETARHRAAELLSETQSKLFEYCHITIGLSERQDHPDKASFAQAHKAVLQRIALGHTKVIQYGVANFKSIPLELDMARDKILSKIELGDQQVILDVLDKFQSKTTDRNADPVEIIEGLVDFYGLISKGLKKQYIISGILPPQRDVRGLLENTKSKRELFGTMEKLVNDEFIQYNELKAQDSNQSVRTVKQFVHERYADNITLQDVAAVVHMNSSYLSSLFKKETGMNFNEYLTRHRIQMAKEFLMEPGLSVAEVGQRVGYEDFKYFSKVFKKVMGMNPTEYRKFYS